MRFCLIINSDPDQDQSEMPEWISFHRELVAAGAHSGGEALQEHHTAKTVKVRDGKTLVLDGPTNLGTPCGGFYIIDVPSMEEAVEWAAKIPATKYGNTEIRPIMEIPEDAFETT